jgi:hypothetical protein
MEPVILPVGYLRRSPFDYKNKEYQRFKNYIVNTLFLKDEDEFDELFYVRETNNSLTLNVNGYSKSFAKRFTKGRAAFLSIDEIDQFMELITKKREELKEEKKLEIIQEKAQKLLNKLLEKYEDDEDKNNGFSIEFNYMRVDYPNSIYIRYKPIDDLNFQDAYNYEFSGYNKPKEEDEEKDYFENSEINEIDNLPEEDIKALLNREDTDYDFVITSYKKKINRFTFSVVDMYILIDGTLTKPEFDLNSDWQKSLDKIIKLSDKCIEWQIDIVDFAENLKKEINPKYFELSKI